MSRSETSCLSSFLMWLHVIIRGPYRSRAFEKHQLSPSSRARKKEAPSVGSPYVLIAWTLSTRTDAEMHVGHLRHVCSCSPRAARQVRAIVETKSHQSGLGLSNETVLLQRRWTDTSDEQPSVSPPHLVSHVTTYAGFPFTMGIFSVRPLGWSYSHEPQPGGGGVPAPEQRGPRLPLHTHLSGETGDKKTAAYRETNPKRCREESFRAPAAIAVMEQDAFASFWNSSGSQRRLPRALTPVISCHQAAFGPHSKLLLAHKRNLEI